MSRFFGKICQNGYVVRDIEAAMDHWTRVLGVGPFYYIERVEMQDFICRGVASEIEVSIALGNSEDLQIELIQQRNTAASMYREFLDAGREGLQHMAYWTKTYQADFDRLIALGYTVGQQGQIGGEKGRFCYFDTESHAGTVVELSDISGPKGEFFQHIRRVSENWDGSRPVRIAK